jgi:hypothetical protein
MTETGGTVKCSYCNGSGRKGPPQMRYDCPDCGGAGRLTPSEDDAIAQRYYPEKRRGGD